MISDLTKYLRNVRSEVKKVTWPSKKETTSGTIAVFVMVFLAAIFLYVSDQVIAVAIRFILGFEI